MSPKTLSLQAMILIYCLVTVAGLLYTVTGYALPFVPEPLTQWSYFTMAPFRGYDTVNSDLRAEGKHADGSWKTINLDRYHPLRKPEQVKLRRLERFLKQREETGRIKYRELAHKILEREKSYESVRLTWEVWPMSVKGWDTNRTPDRITQYPLAEVSR
jgi:hypothetical protein